MEEINETELQMKLILSQLKKIQENFQPPQDDFLKSKIYVNTQTLYSAMKI